MVVFTGTCSPDGLLLIPPDDTNPDTRQGAVSAVLPFQHAAGEKCSPPSPSPGARWWHGKSTSSSLLLGALVVVSHSATPLVAHRPGAVAPDLSVVVVQPSLGAQALHTCSGQVPQL